MNSKISPVGIFLLGAPGSGKDYLLKHIFSRFDLTEVHSDHILNGSVSNLFKSSRNIVINGIDSAEKMRAVKSIISPINESYRFDSVYVSVTNKVSRLRNLRRNMPLTEDKRFQKYESSLRFMESIPNVFVFNNSINLHESSEMERIFFASQIEKLLERLIYGLDLEIDEKPAVVGPVEKIAKLHNVSPTQIIDQVNIGMSVESQKTIDKTKALKTVYTNLTTNPAYYAKSGVRPPISPVQEANKLSSNKKGRDKWEEYKTITRQKLNASADAAAKLGTDKAVMSMIDFTENVQGERYDRSNTGIVESNYRQGMVGKKTTRASGIGDGTDSRRNPKSIRDFRAGKKIEEAKKSKSKKEKSREKEEEFSTANINPTLDPKRKKGTNVLGGDYNATLDGMPVTTSFAAG